MHLVCPLFKDLCFKLILCEVASLESSNDRRLPGRGEFLCVEPSPVSCSLHTLRQQHSLAKTHVNTDTKLVIILKAFFLGTICQWHFTKLCSTDTWKKQLVCLETLRRHKVLLSAPSMQTVLCSVTPHCKLQLLCLHFAPKRNAVLTSKLKCIKYATSIFPCWQLQ